MNKTALFSMVAAALGGAFGCAPRVARPVEARGGALVAVHGAAARPAPQGGSGPQGWAVPQAPKGWAIPQGWAVPQGWSAPQGAPGWAVPQGWAAPQGAPGWAIPQGWAAPQGWAFPWPGGPAPQGGAKKVPAPAAGAPAAVAFATSRLGAPYCWGGNGPGCYDCSGLTSASWKTGGKVIPRTSEAQADLPEVPFDQIVPGDILWRPGHVALYVGNGRVIHAPRTGDVVKYAAASRFVKAVRP